MRTFYRALAYIICGLVMLQAASHAWVSSGLALFIGQGNTIDPTSENLPSFPEAAGFMIHGMTGMLVIPVVALILLGVSFAAKVQRGVLKAAIVLALVALQVLLGMLGHSLSAMAFLHGVNAMVLFGAAFVAARSPERTQPFVAPTQTRTPAGVA